MERKHFFYPVVSSVPLCFRLLFFCVSRGFSFCGVTSSFLSPFEDKHTPAACWC